MDINNTFQLILKKLDNIENRLKTLEQESPPQNQSKAQANRDPFFSKAIEIINKYEEISAQQLAKELKIDLKRAENLMDQLEEAGLGVCYTKEI